MSAVADDLELYRFSSAEYHGLIEAGGLDEDMHAELLEGLLVTTGPRTREHEQAVARLTGWLGRELDWDRFLLGVRSPLSLADGFEPEPDLSVIARETPRPYHPATAALVIEVAASSGRHDLGVKPRVYAAAGVPVYLVVDLDRRLVIEHRDPIEERYESVGRVERLDPRLPGVEPLDSGELIAAAFA